MEELLILPLLAAKRGGGLLGTSAYAASKAGVIWFDQAIAERRRHHSVLRVMAFAQLNHNTMTQI